MKPPENPKTKKTTKIDGDPKSTKAGGKPGSKPPAMKPIYWVMLIGCILMAVAYFTWDFLSGPPSVEGLAAQAVSGSDAKERLQAVTSLGLIKEKKVAIPALRRVVQDAKDPDVVVIALHNLIGFYDYDSLPVVFKALAHSDKKVREAANGGLVQYFGGKLPNNILYHVVDSPEHHAESISKLEEYYKQKKTDIVP